MPLTAQVTKATAAAPLAQSQQNQLSLSQSSAVMATFAPHIAIGSPMSSPSAKKTPAKPKPSATPTATPSSASATPSPSTPTSPTQTPSSTATAASGLTPAALPGNVTPKGTNQLAWSEAILAALGAPDTDANIISMGYWMQNEAGGLVGENNPINVSEQGYDGWNIQSEGNGWYLRSYPTVADGVAAIAAYLSYPNYSEIKGDLQAGVGLDLLVARLASSPYTAEAATRPFRIRGAPRKGSPRPDHSAYLTELRTVFVDSAGGGREGMLMSLISIIPLTSCDLACEHPSRWWDA